MPFKLAWDKVEETAKTEWRRARKLYYVIKFLAKKTTIIFIRSHMSHVLAVTLAVFAIIREIIEYFHYNSLFQPWAWFAFIIGLSVFTVFAAIWELFGNKLATSKQEVRFIVGMNKMLKKYNVYERNLEKSFSAEESKQLLQTFLDDLLKSSSEIICGKHTVDVALMLEDQGIKCLVLDRDKFYQNQTSDNRAYPTDLNIPLVEKPADLIGPAEIAFKKRVYIAHMPDKYKKIGLLFTQNEGEVYGYADVFEGWFPANNSSNENFRSVLAVPVMSYRDEDASKMVNEILGVLNFTTHKKDLFVDRDYITASCFSILVAQAIVANRNKTISFITV